MAYTEFDGELDNESSGYTEFSGELDKPESKMDKVKSVVSKGVSAGLSMLTPKKSIADQAANSTSGKLSPSQARAGKIAVAKAFTSGEPVPEEGGFINSAARNGGQNIKGAGQVGADYLGASQNNAVKQYGQSVIDANPTAVNSLSDIAAKPGTAVAEATGNAAPSMAGMVGARAVGQGITALSPLAGPLAPVVAAAGQVVSWLGPAAIAALPSYGGIRDKQILNDPKNEQSAKAIAIATMGAAAVGTIEQAFGPQQWALAAMTKEGRVQLAKKFAATSLPGSIGKGVVKSAGIEGAEELAQNPIEQLASGDNPTTPANIKDTLFGGAMGAIGGGVLGGGTGMILGKPVGQVSDGVLKYTAERGGKDAKAMAKEEIDRRAKQGVDPEVANAPESTPEAVDRIISTGKDKAADTSGKKEKSEAIQSSVFDEPTPKPVETLDAQISALDEGRKPGVLLTPGEAKPDTLPEGVKSAEVPDHGTLLYRDDATLEAALNGQLGTALGYGIDEKPTGATHAVTARDENGTVIQDVATDGSASVVKAATVAAGPSGTVEVRPIKQAIEERKARIKAAKDEGTGGAVDASDIRPLVESLIKRKAVASQIGRSRSFDKVLAHANDFLAGKETEPAEFKKAAELMNADKPTAGILLQLHDKAKAKKLSVPSVAVAKPEIATVKPKGSPLTPEERANRAPVLAKAKILGIRTTARKFSEIEKDVMRLHETTHERQVGALSDDEYQAFDDRVMDLQDTIDNDEVAQAAVAEVGKKHKDKTTRAYYEALIKHFEEMVHETKPESDKTGSGKTGAESNETRGGIKKQPDTKAPEKPKFNRSIATDPSKIVHSNVEAVVQAIRAKWKNSPEIIIIDSMDDAPIAARAENNRQLSKGAKGNPEGFIHKGKVYIVASEMKSPDDVRRVVLHESLGHYGLRGVFGKDLDKVLNQIAMLRRSDVAAKAKQYGLDMNNPDERLAAAEEVLAELAQSNPQLGFVQRAIAAIRAWLKKNIPGFETMKLTDADITQQFLIPARAFVERGSPSGKHGVDTRFSYVWHGTQHTWAPEPGFPHGRPRLDKMGSGEGAQSYGAGWYSAESQAVGKSYHDKLSLHAKQSEGSLYHLDIPDAILPYMLDWDKPLSKQSSEVQKAVGKISKDRLYNLGISENYTNLDTGKPVTGGDLVDYTKAQYGGKDASEYLASIGIVGTRYLDSGSRSDGKGTHNFVVWDQPTLDKVALLKRNGEVLDAIREAESTAQPPSGIRFSRSDQSNLNLQGRQSGNNASWDAPEPSKMDDLIYKLQNKHVDLKRVIEAIQTTSGKLSDKWNTYQGEELFHERAAKRVKDFVNKDLKSIVMGMKLRGQTVDDLDKYLHARHAEEANDLISQRDPNMPDGGSGMTTKDAKSYLANIPANKLKALENTAKQVDAVITKTRDLYVSYGLIDQATATSWQNMFKHYVPLMREDDGAGMGVGQGFSIKGKEVKHRTGSTRKVTNILANIAFQHEKAIVRGEKNRVAVSLMGLAKLNPNPDFWTFQNVPQKHYDPATGQVVMRADSQYKNRDNVVVAKIKDSKGEIIERAVIFNEHNERAMRMAQAIKNLDATQLEGVLGVSAIVTRYFAAINTQYNPIFGIINLVRDLQASLLNLSSTKIAGRKTEVLKNILPAIGAIYSATRGDRKGKTATSPMGALWDEMQLEGGMTGYRDLFKTSEDRAEAIKRELDPTAWMKSDLGKIFTAGGALKVPLAIAQKRAGWLFDWLSDYNQTLEGAMRLSVYKVAIDKGLSKPQAASIAKNISVNFNRKGQAGQQAGALYAFFNAAMQGTARIGETMTTMDKGDIKTLRFNRTGKTIIAGGISLGVLQALALSAAGFDDDEPPEFVRERSLIIPIGDKKYITIPMPLGFHAIPNIGRLSTEYALGGFKNPADYTTKLFTIFAEAFNPIGSSSTFTQTLSPTVTDPLVALAENKDWTGKPIFKEDFNKLSPTPGFSRNKDTASDPAKMIAEAINTITGGNKYVPGKASPTADQIDYLVGQLTGGVGREAGKAQQSIKAITTGEDLAPHKIPLIGRFYGNSDAQSSQGNAFYKNLKRLNEIEAELDGRRKDKLPLDEFKTENPEWRLVERANLIQRLVSKQRKMKSELIQKDAPREEVKVIDEKITNLMSGLNNRVKELKEVQQPVH